MRSRVFPLAIITLFTPICFMALQASDSTEAAPASASQQVQDRIRKEVLEACPVTKPPDQPFVPPAPYWTNHGPDRFWYGTESLWTLLAVQGTWKYETTSLRARVAIAQNSSIGDEASIGERSRSQNSSSSQNDLTAKRPRLPPLPPPTPSLSPAANQQR
jgi:hypothetical protein